MSADQIVEAPILEEQSPALFGRMPTSDRFEAWLKAYIDTGSSRQAAKMAGVAIPTAYAWSKRPDVADRIKKATHVEMRDITYSLTQAALMSVNSLANIATNGRSDETRIAASTALIDRAAKFVESAEMAERLLQLEQAFGPLVMHGEEGTRPLELGDGSVEAEFAEVESDAAEA